LEATCLAAVLMRLMQNSRSNSSPPQVGGKSYSDRVVETLDYMAKRIGLNRVIAGVHYPVDHEAGSCLGKIVGRRFAKTLAQDRAASESPRPILGGTEESASAAGTIALKVRRSALLAWIYGEAVKEIRRA